MLVLSGSRIGSNEGRPRLCVCRSSVANDRAACAHLSSLRAAREWHTTETGRSEMRWIPTLLAGLALCAGLTAHAAHTGTVQPCSPSKPHEVHTLPGFITVHIECERVLLEIP